MGQHRRSNRRKNQNIAPKPFAHLPLSDKVTRNSPTGHHRYHNNCISGQIIGTIVALSPIHIGSGIIDLVENTGITDQNVGLIKTAVRRSDNIVIPGSSLKGVIRSVAEAISKSCVCKTSNKVKNRLKEIRESNGEEYRECNNKTKLCVACRMFGAMEFHGNVAIQDAQHIEGKIVTKLIPPLYPPQRYKVDDRKIPMRRFYIHGKVAEGKTPIEACEVDSKFRFLVKFNNLTKAELGVFFTALGLHSDYPFKLKIGGAKPICFGSVGFQIDEIHVDKQTSDAYLDWDFNRIEVKKGEVKKEWMNGCMTEATNSLIQMNLKMLAEILKYPNTRQCPQPPWTY